MAEYLLLIYENEDETRGLHPTEDAELVGRFQQFIARHRHNVRVAERLHPTSTATSLRRDPLGGVRISDGAFIESKEVVAGLFLITADDLDMALEIAAQVPVPGGGVEIRPVRPLTAS